MERPRVSGTALAGLVASGLGGCALLITGALLVLTEWRVGQLLLAASSVLFCITGLILRRVSNSNRCRTWMLILVVLSGAMAVSSLVLAALPVPRNGA